MKNIIKLLTCLSLVSASQKPFELPNSIDWRDKGVVTSVKNQGGCGSDFAFSTAAAIESAHAIKTGELVDLSAQQILDCSTPYGNGGCDGGDEGLAYQYLIANQGIQDWDSYPYEYDAGQCRFDRSKAQVKIKDYKRFRELSIPELKELIVKTGPLSVGMFADQYTLGDYYEGVYDFPKCPNKTEDLNHPVLLIGYGVENGVPYWLVKNSWGENWGLKGYLKISQEHDCGLTKDVSYPIIA
ncbi:MAG: hypothetical protein GBAus27B_000261 [Mycoplasmataceae bacterium]|nr:MAG: hypothetical protein GBAus27B_000261 [Mycoplasmataceae bacterium]